MRAFIVAAALLALAPSTALADEYNFTVPVRLENAIGVPGGDVLCYVMFVEGGRAVNDQAFTTFDTTGDRFVGNVSVRVTTVRPRASQTQWQCYLRLYSSGGGLVPSDTAVVPEWYLNRTGRTVRSMQFLVQGGRIP